MLRRDLPQRNRSGAAEMNPERAADVGIESLGDVSVDDRECLLDGERVAVGALRRQGLIDVGDGEHPHRQVQRVSSERPGVATGVELLVMIGGELRQL